MELLNNTPPALLLIIGALALMALPATARKAGAIALAIISFFAISQMSDGNRVSFEFLGFDGGCRCNPPPNTGRVYIMCSAKEEKLVIRGKELSSCKM